MAARRPFRIVVASHGSLGAAMLDSAAMICGRIDDAVAIGLQPEQSPEAFGDVLRAAMGDDDRPVLILTDLLGGTPHNVASLICRQSEGTGRVVACVSGTNLGTLLEAATSVESLDPEALAALVTAGRASVVDASRHVERSSA